MVVEPIVPNPPVPAISENATVPPEFDVIMSAEAAIGSANAINAKTTTRLMLIPSGILFRDSP
jgi:hypothetical protein